MALAHDPEGVEVCVPSRRAHERGQGVALQVLARPRRQALLAPVIEGVGIDRIADLPRLQELQEVDPALAGGARKPGEPVVADLRDVAVAALMARPGIIDRDPAADRQCGRQHLVLLGQERPGVATEQGVDLSH